MKKFLLALTLGLILLVSPVVAADKWTIDPNTWKVIVNGQAADKFVLVDGKPYVALDVVGKAFKANPDYNYSTRIISLNPKPIDPKAIKRPAIKGDKEFTTKINAALDLLEQKDFPDYWMVCMNTWDITQLTKRPPQDPDTLLARSFFSATLVYPKLVADSKRYTAEYLAGVLTHEACHNTVNNYSKEQSEKVCYEHELTAFRLIDAPQWMQNDCLNR